MANSRIEGLSKLTGRERYVDDLIVDNVLWGATVRSSVARGRVRNIRFGQAVDWSEFTIVDHRDIPGANEVFLIENDQPVLAASTVRHVHEAVVLLAHESRDMLRRGVADVTIEIEEEPAVFDFRRAPAPQHVQYGNDNVFKHLTITKGDVERALADAPHVIEGLYESGAQEHVYLENQGMLAWLDDDGVACVQGSMQCPYYVVNALKHALGRDESMVRVIQAATGGGFGGKEDYPSNIAVHAALLSLKAGRPVKIIYDRDEDMAATTKRHPAMVRHRTGVDNDGRLLAQDIEVRMDGGAYVTLSPVVLSRGILHAAGPYSCDHVRVDGKAILTNAVPFGAFRGFGAPQTQFANERHMDAIARRLHIDPVELRRINLIKDGDSTATGQIIHDDCDRQNVLTHAVTMAGFDAKREAHATFNRTHPYLKRGVGLATFYHGCGFTGNGEIYLDSHLHITAHTDGRIEICSANTEMGQGTTTIFTQIATTYLGYDDADIIIAQPDTHRVPNSGPTVASRTVMVVGRLIEKACDDLRTRLELDEHARGEVLKDAVIRWHAAHPGKELRGESRYQAPPDVVWDEDTYRGSAYASYAWAAYIAEVEVDLRSCSTNVIDFVAVQDVGRVINETLARGQIQGGVVQAIGWALMEDCVFDNGAMRNNQLTNYIIPTASDVPPIRVAFVSGDVAPGARGAKGLGELPMDGPAPAILNAIVDATGLDPTRIPLTPELLMDLQPAL